MSLIGTTIGALVALLPATRRPDKTHPLFVAGYDAGLKDGRLEARDDARSAARLVDHIETLEREILIEQHLCQHWKAEAERLAKQSREAREQERLEQQRRAMQTVGFIQAQAQLQHLAQSQQNAAQQAQAFYWQEHRQFAAQQRGFDGFCNCVPSRAQVWGAGHVA